MRMKRTSQVSIFDQFAEHDIGQELAGMSKLLDAQPELLDPVATDLGLGARTGRLGMTAESVLRCGLLKQYRQLSYEELAFHVLDSASFQAFARLPCGRAPSRATLQANISAITADTWEAINQQLMAKAYSTGVECGTMWRVDSTAIEAPVHPPTDSTLLNDCVRVMVRLLDQAQQWASALDWQNHSRRARKRTRAIRYTRGKDKKKRLYQDLVKVTQATLGYLEASVIALKVANVDHPAFAAWLIDVDALRPLVARVIDQTQRRVFKDEKVPAKDKVFSIFEPHTDIIIKGGRDTTYGHKLNLTSGKSGLIFDVFIEDGNPADSERFMPMLERHIDNFGVIPKQVAADGGYAAKANLTAAQQAKVKDVAFHKKRGLTVDKMVKSQWVYRKLRNFRAGIEAGISCLKRGYGLARCTWKTLPHFKAYVWSSVVAHNLARLAKLAPA